MNIKVPQSNLNVSLLFMVEPKLVKTEKYFKNIISS